MPRRPTGHIREHTHRSGVVSYSVRFRGRGYPNQRIFLGRSDEGMTRAVAEHEARLIASQILAGTWSPPLTADYVESEIPTSRSSLTSTTSARRERDCARTAWPT